MGNTIQRSLGGNVIENILIDSAISNGSTRNSSTSMVAT